MKSEKSTGTEKVDLSKLNSQQIEVLLKNKKNEERQAQGKKERIYEAKKDQFIRLGIGTMLELSERMIELKKEVLTRGNDLHDEMYEIYGKEPKELNQFSLDSKDGKYRLTVERAERQALDEKAIVHIQTIKEVLFKRFADRNKLMYGIINDLLVKNNKGEYDERMVAKLRAREHEVNDADFSNALDELAKCYYTYGSSTYARGYKLDEQSKKWVAIPMQFSAM
jgi:hypothetical protein